MKHFKSSLDRTDVTFPVTTQNYFSKISKDGLREGEVGALARTEGTLLHIPMQIFSVGIVWHL